MTEIQLINHCKNKDPKAQELLYRKLAPKLFGVCLKYCSCKSTAEDLFQEALITVFTKINQYKNKGSFEGWAKRITINTILQYFKTQKFYEPIAEEKITDTYDEFEIDQSNLDLNYLLNTIQELPSQYRLVFNLYVLDGFSHQEISESLNITIGTSKSNLSRAKQLLRKKIEQNPTYALNTVNAS